MRNFLEDIKLRLESLCFMIILFPIFMDEYIRIRKMRKNGDINLEKNRSDEWLHKQNRWTTWGQR